ncbi:MAG: neutral/alkaline non-lysosomal ceramidase N-terminal domain-containing protein [Verrucomicrobia bacterium]|nr:neutral/alkaline non-lysosomal ceramidase N-terminal domain-containing protein [Verrucomicrobiota bacterium]
MFSAQEEALRAGASRIDITPTLPVMLDGYESRNHLSEGVHDPLSARALAFKQDRRRLVLVSIDNLGFYNDTAAPLRRTILDACQLQPAELFLAATHTHSAPTLTLDPGKGHSNNVAYTRTLQTQLAQVVREALERAVPVVLQAGLGACPVGANRRQFAKDELGNPKIVLGRNPSILTDREVQVLKITHAADGQLAAVVWAYNTHSTSLGPHNYLVSGDVHGLAMQFLENYLGNGTVGSGFAGASGNIDPWYRVLPGFRTTNGWIPEPVLQGTFLGEEVARVVEEIPKPDLAGPLGTAWKTLELPGKLAGGNLVTNNCPPTLLNLAVARVGQVAFVGLGGEVFNEIGQAIKAASPFPNTIIITHCNGAAGYLPTRPAYLEGGYEVRSSEFGPDAADQVVKETLRMLHAL